MSIINHLNLVISKEDSSKYINLVWNITGSDFDAAKTLMPISKTMKRDEISFHDGVKLLGYLCLLIEELNGDILEIGVWKGKSLAFMSKISSTSRRIIGIDPCALVNQQRELLFFQENIFPNCLLMIGYSEYLLKEVSEITKSLALLHIDGGHNKRNVALDFLLYSPFVVSGGFIVFDDYHDNEYSPEVGPAVDLLRVGGFFRDFNILGTVDNFRNSYVLQRI